MIRLFCILGFLSLGVMSFVPNGSHTNALEDCDNPIKLKFKQDTINFGTITAGTKINLTYEFEVVACDSIEIRQVYTGCNCTSPSYSNSRMAPGAQGHIDLIFDSEEWGADTGRAVERRVYIMYTGGSQDILFQGIVNSAK